MQQIKGWFILHNTTTIRMELERFMKQGDLNTSRLAQMAGINAGTMSSLLHGHRVMAVTQLDRITATLGLSEGHFYEQYIEEYLNEAEPNWRRIRPFLYRCAALDKLECIRQTVGLLLDNLTYSPLLFEVAEDFFKCDQREAAAVLFESIAMSEKSQHSERLALCQFRLFSIRLGEDQELNNQAAIQFEPYVERLDEVDQLDALKELANIYRSLRRWNKVEEMARKMGEKAKIHYFTFQRDREELQLQNRLSRPPFFYLAYSNLLLVGACEERGDYKQALYYLDLCADLSWVKEDDGHTLHWKGLFEEWVKANTYVVKLFSGEINVINDYVEYFERNKGEILPGLLNIVDAANRFQINIDSILQHFDLEIKEHLQHQEAVGEIYTKQLITEQSARFSNELAEYYLRNGVFTDGYQCLIRSLEISTIINNKTCIIKCVGLFESYKRNAPTEVITTYESLILEVYENEKKMGINAISS
ncbi:helix-turn-helix domain-containing protein [Paenibacillus medicaginis]|uniref:Helix-turn-helix domain-containing protein n=1 Tax=Paenibacillus medicaginis TaxID=1470560 RepID=A0ABV5C339_9BACL